VQAAIVIHGNSKVLYLDNKKVLKKQFDLGTSDDVPFKMQNNSLYFHYFNFKTIRKNYTLTMLVKKKTPKVLCVAPNHCYKVQGLILYPSRFIFM
jgi:antitoxin component of MazEF toxin-antitoxin module